MLIHTSESSIMPSCSGIEPMVTLFSTSGESPPTTPALEAQVDEMEQVRHFIGVLAPLTTSLVMSQLTFDLEFIGRYWERDKMLVYRNNR